MEVGCGMAGSEFWLGTTWIKIFPWLKQFNKANKEQLSLNDIEEELKMIKLNILKIKDNNEKIVITELTDIQIQIFNQLKVNTEGLKQYGN